MLICIAVCCFTGNAMAQYVEIRTNPGVDTAKDSTVKQQTIEELFGKEPDRFFSPYLDSLIERKEYKHAEKLVQEKLKHADGLNYPLLLIDLGSVYESQGKTVKSKEQYDKSIEAINGDDVVTRTLARAFTDMEKYDLAANVYERAEKILMNPYMYVQELAVLYAKSGNLEKSADLVLTGLPGQIPNAEQAKTLLLKVINNDQAQLSQLQKILLRKINEQPENVFYVEILTWIYTQKNDWDGALLQIEALDARYNETGKRLLDFARFAVIEHQYEVADKAYADITAKGADGRYFLTAWSEQLGAGLARLKYDPALVRHGVVDTLLSGYDSFQLAYPSYDPGRIAGDYASVAANYGGDAERAISILQKVVYRDDIRRETIGALKLQLGDDYLLAGKLWDASLTYSQVDKEFKQDAMGEDARFRNARLAYYRGDFKWAQRQLLILKSATSELIANDALALSVLITENVEDSVTYPLVRFAYADLLLAQNKEKKAYDLLDSIAKAFPKHPLNDDILMLHAKNEERHKRYDSALAYLEKIHKDYGDDVLADDAVYEMAEIYRNNLNDKTMAKAMYEQLIIEYPGSTFVQAARQRLYEIEHPAVP